MKIRNGRPTKGEIQALLDQHGLVTNHLDSYTRYGTIAYGGRTGADAKAVLVALAITREGFEVWHTHSNRDVGLNGIIRVQAKGVKP